MARSLEIERQSSIELEPRTLSLKQLRFAREVAMCVVSTRSMEEALDIFTEGLQPVSAAAGPHGGPIQGDEVEAVDAVKLLDLREIASAPF